MVLKPGKVQRSKQDAQTYVGMSTTCIIFCFAHKSGVQFEKKIENSKTWSECRASRPIYIRFIFNANGDDDGLQIDDTTSGSVTV